MTITPETIAFVSGQEELINILIAEYKKQQEGMVASGQPLQPT